MGIPRNPGNFKKGDSWPKLRGRAVAWMVRFRGIVMLSVIAMVALLEIFEQMLVNRMGWVSHTLLDLALFALLAPLGMWVMLDLLKSTESQRAQAALDSSMQSEFSLNLSEARTWDELVLCIVRHIHQAAPKAQVVLYVAQPKSGLLQAEAMCLPDGSTALKPALPPELISTGEQATLPLHRYDLPISKDGQPIGVIKLEYPLRSTPTPGEVQALKSAAALIALALESALLQNLAAEQAAASESARQQIAQNLHDTLAQNISYLRLKLDQLTGEDAIRGIGGVLQELERMRATADEAYQQVRNTLDELNPMQVEDLATTVIKQAEAISERAGITLIASQSGAAYALPTAARQHVLYIAREALFNVEKHARACQVRLHFLWLESELILKITDDGVGFNALASPTDGHYGLWIMTQRAREIGGTLKIAPAQNGVEDEEAGRHGTEVTLWVPRKNNNGQG